MLLLEERTIMFDKYHHIILRISYNMGCLGERYCTKPSILMGLPVSEGNRAYQDLVRWDYLKGRRGSENEELVSLNPTQIQEVRQLLNPRTPDAVKDKPPVEYSYDSKYEQRPFHKTKGDKRVRGTYGIYSYHKNHSDPTILIAYIIVDGERRGTIKLGSFFDKNSLLSNAIKKIDEKYWFRQFSKADLRSLGRDIEGNRQPPKAIIDMLLYHGYIAQMENRYYERTEKQLPKTELYDFQSQHSHSASASTELTTEKENPSQSGFPVPPSHQTTTAAIAYSSLFGEASNNG